MVTKLLSTKYPPNSLAKFKQILRHLAHRGPLKGTIAECVSVEPNPERRREPRYKVDLRGWLQVGPEQVEVRIDDLSSSGALIFMNSPPLCGTRAELRIEDFGGLSVDVMRSGHCFCGVAFCNPAADRERLLDWLLHEAKSRVIA